MELLKQPKALAATTRSGLSTKRAGNESIVHPAIQRALPPGPSTACPGQECQDAALPALAIALDPAMMTPILRARLLPVVPAGGELTMTTVELLDYKPGKRGLIRYALTSAEGHEGYTILGKLYTDPDQLARVHQGMAMLWTDVFGDDLHCSVPQPLGVVSELSMLLYLPAEGHFLDEVITGERAAYAIELTGRWLSTLHSHPLPLTKQFHLAGELANLAAWAGIVGQTYPELAPLAQQALHYLQQQATRLSFATQTPIHKDFHYRHVLIERGVKVIDFDELRLGDPTFDLAHFCVNLHLLAYRQHGSPHHLRGLEHRFLAAYARNTHWSLIGDHSVRFAYFYVYTCLKLARQLCLGFGPSPLPTGEARQRQVSMILSQAVTTITIANNC